MRTPTFARTLVLLAAALAAACATEPAEPRPEELKDLATRVKAAVGELKTVSPANGELEHQLFELEETGLTGEVSAASCDAVDEALATVCGELYEEGKVASCWYTTSFFYAHVTPRCAVRFETYAAGGDSTLHPIHALDFAGTPLEGPVPSCGNGALDVNEMCDDGNHESWDGCDANCNQEEFQGCERVIEDIYQQAGLASVAAADWTGPKSHLMVNRSASALRALDAATCDAAIATAADVCTELTEQMPFVSWCQPEGLFHDDDGEPACSIRLQVWFDQLDPGFGVFTTSLPGLLAFTIR